MRPPHPRASTKCRWFDEGDWLLCCCCLLAGAVGRQMQLMCQRRYCLLLYSIFVPCTPEWYFTNGTTKNTVDI
jgi:hypothetical protein